MTALNITEARRKLAWLMNRVEHHGERIALRRHGREVGALVSADDLRLLEILEDQFDIEEAVRLLGERHKAIPFDEAIKDLGLD